MKRADGRAPDELRKVEIELGFTDNPAGSVLIRQGRTLVLCTATLEKTVPAWLRGSGRGWVTGEYSLLPGSTDTRTEREAAKGKVSGRTQEIQRLIGRSLRAVTDLNALGERCIWVDCDVLQADGGTRTAAITGGYIALHRAVAHLQKLGAFAAPPMTDQVAAVSCGLVAGTACLDLDYAEDSTADADANFVLTGSGGIVEVQGTAEKLPFSEPAFIAMLGLARTGIAKLVEHQRRVLGLA